MTGSLIPDLPAWVVDIIEARAQATGMSYDEALLASLNVQALDPLAQTLGWAAERGIPHKVIARRTHYSRRTVEDAASRYKRRRL
ncbi:helix-turn-helix DNA binding domain protein [Microbacterium phage Jefe]|uniref:Helix-turn-helix DNA binding domain n=1 Tax=Microbacterium phage Crisis TaxID=3158889 RepID=A0AAU8GNM0_9CAUD|nr:helix-turn-helix DNA binding domain protein [Microbacterium phage Jefe]